MPNDLSHAHIPDIPVEVPQEYTHKANHSEVLLRRWSSSAENSFIVSARWPGEHSFYEVRHGLDDPLLLCETVRQTLPLLSHGAYQVPSGHQLLWKDFGWSLERTALRSGPTEAEVELRITATDVKYRRERASALALSVHVTRNGVPLGTACTRFAIQERAVYERLRGRYADISGLRVLPLAPPASPAQVGRLRFEDVALSATDMSDRWQLRVDPTHPILFDHPVDHAPGMLILEAARQAALAATDPLHGVVTGMETVFNRYAELDEPCWIAANRLPGGPDGLRRVTVTGEQRGRPVFTCTVTLTDASGS